MKRVISREKLNSLLSQSGHNDYDRWWDYDYSDESLADIYFTFYYNCNIEHLPQKMEYTDLLPLNVNALLTISSSLIEAGLVDWLVFAETPEKSWNWHAEDKKFNDLFQSYLNVWDSDATMKGAIEVKQDSLFDILCLLHLYSWKFDAPQIECYCPAQNMFLLLTHHGTIRFIGMDKNLLQQIEQRLLTKGVAVKWETAK